MSWFSYGPVPVTHAPDESLHDEKISQDSIAEKAEEEGESTPTAGSTIADQSQDDDITENLEKDVISTELVASTPDTVDIFGENAGKITKMSLSGLLQV